MCREEGHISPWQPLCRLCFHKDSERRKAVVKGSPLYAKKSPQWIHCSINNNHSGFSCFLFLFLNQAHGTLANGNKMAAWSFLGSKWKIGGGQNSQFKGWTKHHEHVLCCFTQNLFQKVSPRIRLNVRWPTTRLPQHKGDYCERLDTYLRSGLNLRSLFEDILCQPLGIKHELHVILVKVSAMLLYRVLRHINLDQHSTYRVGEYASFY